MNGRQIESREMDAYALLQQMRRERGIVSNLKALGFTGQEAVNLLSHTAIIESKAEGDSQRYDYRDDSEGGKVIIWLNDIEKDKRYDSWPGEVSAILQRTWPGQLPQVRRDIHNVVIPMDLTDAQDIEILVEQLQIAVKRKFPIRFGIVPLVYKPAAVDQAKLIYHLWDTYGLSALFKYFELSMKDKSKITANRANFEASVKDRKIRQDRQASRFEDVIAADSENPQMVDTVSEDVGNAGKGLTTLDKLQRYLKRLGICGQSAPFFTNGVAMPRNDPWL